MENQPKNLQVLLLKDQWLLAKVEEIEGVEFGDPDCILTEPLAINGTNPSVWTPFAHHKEIVIRSSDILTFMEPGKELLSKYYAFKPIEPEVLTE